MLPTRILLDLDDVCNRFTMYALKQVGCPVDELAYRDFNPAWGWDIVSAANALHPTREFTPAEFWGSLSREVWANVPESSEFGTLLRRCEALAWIPTAGTWPKNQSCGAGVRNFSRLLNTIRPNQPNWNRRRRFPSHGTRTSVVSKPAATRRGLWARF